MKKNKGVISRFGSYLGHYKFSLFLVFILALISTGLTVAAPRVTGLITTELFEGIKTQKFNVDKIIQLVVIVIAIYTIGNFFATIQNFKMATVVAKTIELLRADVDKKMHKMKLDYYDTHTNGEILSTITNDIDSINASLTHDLTEMVRQIFKAIGIVIMMFSINVWLALVAIVTLPITYLVSKGVLLTSTKKYAEQQNLIGELNGVIEEQYNGQNVIQAFNHQESSIKDFEEVNQKLQKCAQKAESSASLMMPITTVVNNAGYIIGAVLGCTFAINGTMTIGNVQAMVQYIKQFSEPFNIISGMTGTIGAAVAALKRVFELLDAEEEIPDPENSKVPTEHNGAVEFKNVQFGYVPGKLLMNDVSIKVKPGQKVAVVGPTGAGKTTLINLLMRFYEINGGEITVDGVNTKDMTREELRNRFAMVLQDTWLFEGTIMENLMYGNDNVTEEDVYAASKTAGTDNFIKTLPNAYKMKLDKGAENISQGERQMLTIVRAMAVNPEIMILDEATSNVDTHTELMIQNAMSQLMKGRTSFVIAHRLSTIKDSNMILYMENGDIKEVGNHDELMQLNGKYAALYNSQFA